MVRFKNVGVRYGVGPEVLRDINLHIEPGSFYFFYKILSIKILVKYIYYDICFTVFWITQEFFYSF